MTAVDSSDMPCWYNFSSYEPANSQCACIIRRGRYPVLPYSTQYANLSQYPILLPPLPSLSPSAGTPHHTTNHLQSLLTAVVGRGALNAGAGRAGPGRLVRKGVGWVCASAGIERACEFSQRSLGTDIRMRLSRHLLDLYFKTKVLPPVRPSVSSALHCTARCNDAVW